MELEENEQRLMKVYPSAFDYIQTQPTYSNILDRINKKNRKIIEEIDDEFISNINVRKKKEFYIPDFPEGWEDIFETAREKIEHAIKFVNGQIMDYGNNVFPENENLFNAFRLPPHKIKVIIIGQDPYYTRDKSTNKPVANGMSFSCLGYQIQPSLKKVFEELKRTHGRFPSTGDLTFWADQGVLLLNTCLTVDEGKPKSHGKAWSPAIKTILQEFFSRGNRAIVCLWGAFARDFFGSLEFPRKNAIILESGHPSTMNTSSKQFLGCGHFKEIDDIFIENGLQPIDWLG